MIVNFSALPIADSYDGTITFENETAGYRNAFGMYKIDDSGTIYDVEIVFANSSAQGSGGSLIRGESSVDVSFEAGDLVGFFVLPNANNYWWTSGYLDNTDGHFEMRNTGGEIANIDDEGGTQLHFIDDNGRTTAIQSVRNATWHSAADEENNFGLNPDYIDHTIWELTVDEGELQLDMRFEDLYGGGDRDFTDIVFSLDVGAVNAVTALDENDRETFIEEELSNLGEAVADVAMVTSRGTTTIDPVANDTGEGLTLTHVNGQSIDTMGTLTLASGVTLAHAGGNSLLITGADSTTELSSLVSYTAEDANGDSIQGFIAVTSSPVDGTEGDDQMHAGFTDADGNQVEGTDGASEVVMGYGGNDKMFVGAGNDVVFGGAGNDFMRGGTGNDMLDGDSGDDFLDGGAGVDTMTGGAGDDVYWVDDANDVVSEAGGDGYDEVKSMIDFILGDGFEELRFDTGSTATVGTGNALDNAIYGNDLDNTLSGLAGDDKLNSYGGDDTLDGGTGADNLLSGGGSDVLLGGEGNDKLFAGSGNDDLSGGEGNDLLRAEAGDDTITGDAGNDSLDGGTGADMMTGGAGDDFYWVDNAADQVIEGANEGKDRVYSTVDITLSDNVEDLWLKGSAVSGTGNDLNNSLRGGNNDNTLSAEGGNDVVYGLNGNDMISGGAGNDRLDAGVGNDTVSGGAGRDRIKVGRGDDVVQGGEDNDTIVLAGGEDTLIFRSGDGDDLVFGFDAAEDVLALSGIEADDLSLSTRGRGMELDLGNGDSIYFAKAGQFDLDEMTIDFGADTLL